MDTHELVPKTREASSLQAGDLAVRERRYHTRIFVVKVASRCNLACTYCYMYQHADQSWRNQPTFMSAKTIRRFAVRLEEHAQRLAPWNLMVVAHGGEPLQYPFLDEFFDEIRSTVKTCRVEFAIQTNATLFDEANLAILDRHGVRVGISLDGNRETHNRMRVAHDGSGTYDRVMQGLRLAQTRIPHLVDSVLQVIDPSVSPVEMLDTLESLGIGRADLLFPDFNHDTICDSGIARGQIGDWLCAVFDEWVRRPKAVHLRIFLTIIHLLRGQEMGTDQLGAWSDAALMLETDGSYHIYDGLKTAYEGAGCTGMNVENASVADVETLPLAKAFMDKASGAATECLQCRLFPICGGGSPIHRYSISRGFAQPSVYCADLTHLITHIAAYVRAARPATPLVI